MNVLYVSSNEFLPKMAASLCSLLENNIKESELEIFLLGQNISDENSFRLRELAKRYDRNINIIRIGDVYSYIDFYFDSYGWSPIVLARILVARFIPRDIDRILYIDSDTIILGPLKDLWETNMCGKTIGACIEATCDIERRRDLLGEGVPYINSGVLLIDLEKWRNDDCENKIWEFYKANREKSFTGDQDAINGALKGSVFYIHPKYNYCSMYWTYSYRFVSKLMSDTEYYSKSAYDEAISEPAIIHYMGEERPWRSGNRHRFRQEYEDYLNKTDWKDDPNERGWYLYFACLYTFNVLTRPIPSVRHWICSRLMPILWKWRRTKLSNEKK